MMPLLDLGPTLHERGALLGCEYGQLITPLTKYANRGGIFAVDNGAYSGFDGDTFLRLLDRNVKDRERCLFVAVPDVVGCAQRTREVWDRWAPRLSGWPLAYVTQDGQDHVEIPWDEIAFVFIGGTNGFKDGPVALGVIKTGQILGVKVHVGRINSVLRFSKFDALGCDTCDGSGMSRYDWMREAIAMRHDQQSLFEEMTNA